MADFYVDYDGNITKKKKKQAKYYLDAEGKINMADSNDIAPVKEQSSGYFQKGNDNVVKAASGTVGDFFEDFGAGILGLGEKIVDGLAFLGQAQVRTDLNKNADNLILHSALTGKDTKGIREKYNAIADDVENKVTEFQKKDLYDEHEIARELLANVQGAAYMSNINQSGGFATVEDWERYHEMHDASRQYIDTKMEADSILGEKADALAYTTGQFAAQQALNAVGVPWWATTAVSTLGSEGENALNQGATFNEALTSGLISAGGEVISEKLFGGMFGEIGLDDVLIKDFSKICSNKLAAGLVKVGIKAGGEGFEEIFSEVAGKFGQWITYQDEKTFEEMFASEEALESYIDSFIGGAFLGGVSNTVQAVNSEVHGVDYASGLTNSEKTVVDKLVQDEIAQREKDGKKVTLSEKSKIHDDILKKMEKGNISVDTIEEVLGGEDYKSYKNVADAYDKLKTRYDELGNKQTPTLKEQYEYSHLVKALETNKPKVDSARAKLDSILEGQIKDSKLAESYREVERGKHIINLDTNQYKSEAAKKTARNFIDFGINDTNEAHDFADLALKLSEDKGYEIVLTSTKALEKSVRNGNPYNIDADPKKIQAFVSEGHKQILVNMDSKKSLNSLVGHEITDTLRNSEYYSKLQKIAFAYAKSKGEYKSRLADVEHRYETIKNADFKGELTSDLVGDYLFTDEDFVRRLSVEDRNLFQKIWDEIKYMYKLATAGSREARELERLKHQFEKVWKETSKASTTENHYSLSADSEGNALTDGQKQYFKDSKVVDNNGKLLRVYHTTKNDFTVFDKSKKGTATEDANTYLGFFFSDDAEYMQNFPEFQNGKTESYYLNMKNPIDMTNISKDAFLDIVEVMGGDVTEVTEIYDDADSHQLGHLLDELTGEFYYNDFIKELKPHYDELMSRGYDGVISHLDEDYGAKEYIVLDSNQAKLTSNENPTEDADIRYSLTEDELQDKYKDANGIKYNYGAVESHKKSLAKNITVDSSVSLDTIMQRYDKILGIWERLGGELDSKFLNDWNNKTERPFTIFKAQAGYKYNVELSSMCKKGVPLFEAIDTIIKKEVMKDLDLEVLGKEEKEILYDILKQHDFEIPCAICYVEQARQREGVIIDAFLNGNDEGKLGWNKVLDSIEAEMSANGITYKFPNVSRDIATDKYDAATINMDDSTAQAFYSAVQKIANQEIKRYNKAEGKNRKLLKDITPEAVKECFKGTLPSNLKIFKTLLTEPSSRFRIENDLLYSSMATRNLSSSHHALYSLFNSQGGVSGYKTKQGTTIYWGEILGKRWNPSTIRNEGGVRNQSNSDFQAYTLLDQAQMYMDFTAKGYYLQAYTKVLSELKLFGLSKGKINASLIPKVKVYHDANGNVDVQRTMENAGLDEDGNPIYDDFEGINHTEAFMLIEDAEYSKNICGICIGYSDNHIAKLLDDNRVQLIIGYHDKTNDPTKRYRGARYAKNYNGLNEAVDSDGKTKHIGFNQYVNKAEKRFAYNADTETFEGNTIFNGKEYTANDIPKLAADMYLDMCNKKGYTPAYDMFKTHPNYYKLLADFGLYDSQGNYAPHRKVEYNMPDTVPYLDENGNKKYMSSEAYIKAELQKELAVRDSIAEALSDTSENGIIPQFKAEIERRKGTKNYLADKNTTFKEYGNFNQYAENITVKNDIAPMPETVSKMETVENVAPSVEEDVAPTQEGASNDESVVTAETPSEDIIKTVKDKLNAKITNATEQLEKTKTLRDWVKASYDHKIADLQSKYDAKKNKDTKVAVGIKNRIENLRRIAADLDADLARRISHLESKISKTSERMQSPQKKDILEVRYERINKHLEADKISLAEDFAKRKAELQKSLEDKTSYFSKKALDLYNEVRGMRKGVKVSNELGYLLDNLALDEANKAESYNSLRTALLNIKNSPNQTVNQNSAIESIAREMIETSYEDDVYSLYDIDNQYQQEVAKLEKDAEKQRESARKEYEQIKRSDLHRSIIDKIKSKFAEKGFDLDEVFKKAKNLSTLSTVDNTPQRVMEKSLGYKEGQILADETVNKVAQNESEGIKWLNSFTDRKNGVLAKLSKKYNIKPNSKESAAAQMYAEGFYVNDNNEIIKYGNEELAKDFPDAKVRENIKGLANDPIIRQIYDDTLAAINESRARNGYPEIQRLDNYFLHFRAMNDTFSRLGLPFNPNDIKAKDLPTDLNGVTADLKPGQPYFASAMHRKGQRTSFDLLGGLESYLSSAKNQIYHIDDIQTLRALRNYIADTYGQANGLEGLDALSEEEQQEKIKQVYGAHLSTFAKFLNEEANVIAGKTALIDRGLEGIIGRRGITFIDTVNKQVGSNMVGLNVSSSLTNFIAGVQAIAKTNKLACIKSLAQTTSSKVGSIFGKTDSFVENNPTIIRRKGAERFNRTPFQKVGDAGYFLMSAVDNVTTEFIVRAKYNEFIQKGMSEQEAITEADKWTSRLMGDRSLGQMPQLYNSKMLGVITKFQLEVRNQLDTQFYDTIQEAKASYEDIENGLERNAKTAAKVTKTLFELAVLQHLFGTAFESVAGYNPAFDIIGVLATALGFDDDEESEDTALDNIEQGFLELLEDLPYTSIITNGGRIPISSALPIGELIKGEDEYGNEKSRWDIVKETAPYYLLPTGYGQIKKTVQGLSMFNTDEDHPVAGSYTDSGNLRFPVEDTFGNRVQAGIFGQYASKNAREYFDNGYAPLKKKQIQEYVDVDLPIADYWKYREGLKGKEKLEDQLDYISGLDLPVEKKNILANNVTDRKNPIDLENYEDFSSLEEFDFANENPDKYAFAKSVGGYSAYKTYSKKLYDIKADKDEYGKSISGSRKKKVADYINSLDIDYGEKIILYKSQYTSDDTYNYEIIEYLNSRNDISYEEMETILKELGFTVLADGSIRW